MQLYNNYTNNSNNNNYHHYNKKDAIWYSSFISSKYSLHYIYWSSRKIMLAELQVNKQTAQLLARVVRLILLFQKGRGRVKFVGGSDT